jgi:hypothetical protein
VAWVSPPMSDEARSKTKDRGQSRHQLLFRSMEGEARHAPSAGGGCLSGHELVGEQKQMTGPKSAMRTVHD